MNNDPLRFRFSDYLILLARFRWIFLAALTFSTLLAAYVEHQKRDLYKATSTLILIQPKYSTELRPAQMSTELYVKFSMLPQIIRRVSERTGIPDVELNRDILLPGLEAVEGTTSPMLHLNTLHPDNKKAQQIADIWADVFLDEVENLRYSGQSGSYDFINKEVAEAHRRLTQLEKEKSDLEALHPLEILRGKRDILQKQLLSHLDLLNTKRDEYRIKEKHVDKALVEPARRQEVNEEKAEDIRMASSQIALFTDKLSRLQLQIFDHRIDRQQAEIELTACENQLKTEPKYLDEQRGNISPVYINLLERISAQKLKIASYESLRKQVESEITLLKKTVADKVTEKRASSEILETAEFLVLEREIENLNTLITNGEAELRTLNSEILSVETRLKETARSLELVQHSFQELSNKSESTRLAKAENYSDFKILSRATIPMEKTRKHYARTIALYDLATFTVMLVLLVLGEWLKPDWLVFRRTFEADHG